MRMLAGFPGLMRSWWLLLRFLDEIEANLPRGLEVHLIMDKLRHAQGRRSARLVGAASAVPLHFTPTIGSWLNLVERLFGELKERCVRRGSHTAVRALAKPCWTTWTGETNPQNPSSGLPAQI